MEVKLSPLEKLGAESKIDNNLHQVFEIAALLAEKEGKDYVSTTTFVKALVHHNPGSILELFERLPSGALPIPSQDIEVVQTNGIGSLKKLNSFSPCVNSAMANLLPKIDSTRKLSSEDVFVDIALYSGGRSTERLRSHGVTKEMVDLLVRELRWDLIQRDNVWVY